MTFVHEVVQSAAARSAPGAVEVVVDNAVVYRGSLNVECKECIRFDGEKRRCDGGNYPSLRKGVGCVQFVGKARAEPPTKEGAGKMESKRENQAKVIEALRLENQAMHREVQRMEAQVKATEKNYQQLVDTWNAFQAGTFHGRLEAKAIPALQAKGELARKLAEKLLRFIEAEDQDADADE